MKTLRVLLAAAVVFASFAFVPVPRKAEAVVGWVNIQGITYDGVNANITNNIGDSSDAKIVLDSLGNPCIAWHDNFSGNYEIYFARWNGTQWVNAQGVLFDYTNGNVSNNSGYSRYASLRLFNNRPCIAWHEDYPGNWEVYYASWNGTSWVNASGIVLNSSNGNVSNNSGYTGYPYLIMDSIGNPHITFQDNTPGNDEVYYVKWNGSNWVSIQNTILNATNANVSNNAGNSWASPKIVLDSNNNPHLTWTDNTPGNYEIYYTRWNGNNWVNINGALLNNINGNISNNPGFSQYASIILDANERPNIAWFDDSNGNNEIYFAKWDGTNWLNSSNQVINTINNPIIINTSGNSQYPNLVKNSLNQLFISWTDNTVGNYEVYYAKYINNTWVTQNGQTLNSTNANISNNSSNSYIPLFCLDTSNNPIFVWNETNMSPPAEIYLSKWVNSFDGSFSLTKSVDTNSDGDYSDSGKQVNVGDTLKYKINWKFNQGQDPLEEPYLYDTVPEGTHYVAGTTSPNANLSYSLNGGATWITGEPPNGSPAGTQLRWDLSSLWVGAAGSPYIGSAVTQPMDINVSRTGSRSGYYDTSIGQLSDRIIIDKKGFPNIVWDENISGNWEICFVKWNGNNWVNIQGVIYNPALNNANVSSTNTMSILPEFALDKNDYPYICWSEGTSINTTDIWFIKWNGLNWMNVDNTLYNPLTNNANLSNNSGWSMFSTIKLDKNNQPNIAWDDSTFGNRTVFFVKWDGSNWRNIQGTIYNSITGNAIVANPAFDPSLELDLNDNPHLAWDAFGSFYLVHWDGSNWLTVDNLIFNPGTGNARIPSSNFRNSPVVKIGKDGYPRLLLMHLIGNSEMGFIRWDGVKWVNIYGVTYNPATNNHIISNDAEDSWPGALELDKNDYPHMAWQNNKNLGSSHSEGNDIVYVYWNGSQLMSGNSTIYNPATMNANIDNSLGSSKYPSMTLDNNNNPHFTWFDDTLGNDEVFYITKGDERSFSFSVQVENPPATPAFCNEATFRHKWDNGKATLSNTVCNTIDYNFTGKFELKKSVETTGDAKYDDDGKEAKAGDKLNYKIDWSFDNPNSDPLFDAYVYDTIPEGTTYVAGSATTDMLSHSTDGGTTWIAGEPPDGAHAGTRLRWGKIQSKWVDANNFPLSKPNHSGSVSKTQNYSSGSPSITCNSLGFPCIAWNEAYLNVWDIYYIQWDGTKWVNVKNEPYPQYSANVSLNSSSSSKPSLCIDRNGYPCISWHDNATGNWEIFFVRWDGKNWNNISNEIYNGLNANISNNLGDSLYSSLQIDTNNQPHVSWYDNSYNNNEILYVKWNSTGWTNVNNTTYSGSNAIVSNNPGNSYLPCLRLDINNNPNLVWYDDTYGNYEVNFVKYNGVNWVTINNYIYAGQNANISNTISDSSFAWLSLKSNGYPGIAWVEDPMNGEIYYINWNGMNWVTGSNQIYAGNNANISYSGYQSLNPRLAFDKSDQPCIVWCDAYYTPTPPIGSLINFSAQFIRWNGTRWVNANYQSYSSVQKGSIVKNNVFSFLLDLVIDKNNMPHVTWVDYFTNTEIMYAKFLTYTSFTFSVKIIDPFIDYTKSPICNKAEFWHVFDKGNHTKSNSVCNNVYKKPEETKKAKLSITKKAFKFTLGPKDVVHFAVEIENIGDVDAIDVNIYDYFPKELEIYHSIPKGEIGGSSIRYFLELLKAGHKRRFEVMFKVSKSAKIGKDGLYLTNIAKAFSKNSESAVEASATVVIRNDTPSGSVSMNLQMMGVDAKTGVCKKGTEISIKVDPDGGTPPYDIVVDWGDGTQSKAFNVTTDKPPTLTHTYNEAGEYTITIICTDQYGNVCKIIRKVKVE